MSNKAYDLVIFGATSFTAKLAMKYLAETQPKLKWAAAGRNKQKVEAALAEIGVRVPIIVADSSKESDCIACVKQTKALITFVGPYARYGELVVKACAENGVHYFDLTGEGYFIKRMIEKYGVAAIESGACIVCSCGFDSVPSDLTTFLAVQELKRLGGPQTEAEKVEVAQSGKGGVSGGTLASVWDIFDLPVSDKKAMADPYSLSPIQGRDKGRPQMAYSTTFKGKKTWGGFFVMTPHNSAVVRRTAGIFAGADDAATRVFSYGDLLYREFYRMPGLITSILFSSTLFLVFALLAIPPIRYIAKRVLPQPGSGPSDAVQQAGYFRTQAVATSKDGKYKTQVILNGKGDPGYAATSKMIVECALAFVLDKDRLPPLAKRGGFLTPASAIGNVLAERLQKSTFFTISTDSETLDDKKTK